MFLLRCTAFVCALSVSVAYGAPMNKLRFALRHAALTREKALAEKALAEAKANTEATIELFRRTPQWLRGAPGAVTVGDFRYLTRAEYERGERYEFVVPHVEGMTAKVDELGFRGVDGAPSPNFGYRCSFTLPRAGEVLYLAVRRDASGEVLSILHNTIGVGISGPKAPRAAPEPEAGLS